MKLVPGIYYFDCGENVYLRNVNHAKDYLLNPICLDILDYIKKNPGCTPGDICNALAEIYEVESADELWEDVRIFVEELGREQLIADDQKIHLQEPEISEQLQALYQSKGKLYSATLELTYRCNERCVHCYVDDASEANVRKELTLEEYRLILDQLRQMGCIHILLTGGEVCLRKDFLEIARYAVSSGFLVDIYTNGISLTDLQFEQLCDLKVNSVSFSLYSADPAVHDSITKVPGSFERTLKRMMMFKCAGVDTFIKTVVIQQNLDTLEGLFELGRRLNIPVNPATNISDTHTGQSKSDFRLDNQLQRLCAANLIQRYDPVNPQMLHRNRNGAVCRAGITTLSIDPYGGVHPCLAFTEEVGSVRSQILTQIWEEAPLLKKLRKFQFRELSEQCGECGFADTCGVCIGAAYSESGGSFCPNLDSCHWAKAYYDAVSAVL